MMLYIIHTCINLGVMHIHHSCPDLQPSLMAKRGFKLFALAVSFLVGRSFLALAEIPRTTPDRYRRSSKTARSAEPPAWASYLDPIASDLGISISDIGKKILDANNNFRPIEKVKQLENVNNAHQHAILLAKKLMDRAKTSQEARNIVLPNISLPLIPVHGTEFQHLVTSVLSNATSTGVSAIYAEPGTGKSVAVALAMLTWAKHNPKCITILIRGNLKLLKDIFRVVDEAYVPAVAESLFPMLSDEGVRLQMVLDNIFDKELGERGEMLMSLARAAFEYGQVVVVTQSREVAEEVRWLNGARTRVSPEQKCNVSEYRWNEMQASRLLLNLNATAKLKDWRKSHKTRWWRKMLHAFTRTTKESEDTVQRALNESFKKFKQDGAWVQENLEGARMPDGGWKPVDIKQFLLSGIKPVLVPPVAGGDCRERAGLEKHHIESVRKHSTCRRAVFFGKLLFSFPLRRKCSLIYTIADQRYQSKTLQSRPKESSSCPARYNLSNPDQSRLGEATAEGLTRVAQT